MSAQHKTRKTIVIVAIALPVGLLHFVTGRQYHGPFPLFVNGYLIDILLPFAAYFLLCNIEVFPLNRWFVRALSVFGLGCAVELAQYYGLPVFGRTFDPLDFVAYGAGVALAVIVERLIFPRIFSFWNREPSEDR